MGDVWRSLDPRRERDACHGWSESRLRHPRTRARPAARPDPAAVGSGLRGDGRAAPAPAVRAPASAGAPGFLPTRIPLAASRAFTFRWPLPRNGLAFSTVRISCRSSSSLSAVFGPRCAASGYTGPRACQPRVPWIGSTRLTGRRRAVGDRTSQRPALLRSPAKKRPTDETGQTAHDGLVTWPLSYLRGRSSGLEEPLAEAAP